MRLSVRVTSGLAVLALAATTAHLSGSADGPARSAKAAKAAAGFELSVDSIMRGPTLVGYRKPAVRDAQVV